MGNLCICGVSGHTFPPKLLPLPFVYQVSRISSENIKNNYVESEHVGSINRFGEHPVNISTSVKLHLLNSRHRQEELRCKLMKRN